jgi:predicted alpha/beta-fold hydrolase
MPIIKNSTYPKQPFYYGNQHGHTLIPGALRRVKNVFYERERLELPDGDFVDLDWIDKGSKNLVLLTHGLEGDSQRQYMRGMAKFFATQNWDVLAWMCRSCSGEMNRNKRLYYHGEIGDIGKVINHALSTKHYEKIVLVGFSMGGNISMKYLGVHGKNIPDVIDKCIAFSAPADLESSAAILDRPDNWLYKKRFMAYLKAKIRKKTAVFPDFADLDNFKKIKVWRDFDELFSAPINNFENAAAFYEDASAKNFMSGITIPTLLVNAVNDPILTPECSPKELCESHPFLYLENPIYGGHCGFPLHGKPFNWSEYRAWDFVNQTHL